MPLAALLLLVEKQALAESGDANNDGQITVDEILAAVNSALSGCPAQ